MFMGVVNSDNVMDLRQDCIYLDSTVTWPV